MRMVDLIEQKRKGQAHSTAEIEWMINAYVREEIPDYQMAAWLMAVCFRGMDARETADLTLTMMRSGDMVDLSGIPGVKVDKHSTGGVGDTTTLVVAPLVAACGGKVAKMSGRGLGHTGGTLDKLESIPNFCIELTSEQFQRQVNEIGIAVIGQSGNLVPADKKLYALRDVTGTVGSIPLIASSIMSKKLAAGADAIVLDVKVGTGALMETIEDARALAKTMVAIGKQLNRRVAAIITDMNQPLGFAVGNALEVREAVELLCGNIPATDPLYNVCMLLAKKMLRMSDLVQSDAQAEEAVAAALQSGAGLRALRSMVRAQGGDERYIDPARIGELCKTAYHMEVPAKESGYVVGMNAAKIGAAAQALGAGRATKQDKIDPAAGLVMAVRLGDNVQKGQPLCTLYTNDNNRLNEAAASIQAGIALEDAKPFAEAKLVYDIIE
ncbi:pyrimidine-nucleoside phosphorylase [Christensenellaceae bacterium OttesenSCG-928-L17]|nr:pyrimidine-nucleoside phosphorylase [Christensenellaceae bacterium OttesenSCG-928-L17]